MVKVEVVKSGPFKLVFHGVEPGRVCVEADIATYPAGAFIYPRVLGCYDVKPGEEITVDFSALSSKVWESVGKRPALKPGAVVEWRIVDPETGRVIAHAHGAKIVGGGGRLVRQPPVSGRLAHGVASIRVEKGPARLVVRDNCTGRVLFDEVVYTGTIKIPYTPPEGCSQPGLRLELRDPKTGHVLYVAGLLPSDEAAGAQEWKPSSFYQVHQLLEQARELLKGARPGELVVNTQFRQQSETQTGTAQPQSETQGGGTSTSLNTFKIAYKLRQLIDRASLPTEEKTRLYTLLTQWSLASEHSGSLQPLPPELASLASQDPELARLLNLRAAMPELKYPNRPPTPSRPSTVQRARSATTAEIRKVREKWWSLFNRARKMYKEAEQLTRSLPASQAMEYRQRLAKWWIKVIEILSRWRAEALRAARQGKAVPEPEIPLPPPPPPVPTKVESKTEAKAKMEKTAPGKGVAKRPPPTRLPHREKPAVVREKLPRLTPPRTRSQRRPIPPRFLPLTPYLQRVLRNWKRVRRRILHHWRHHTLPFPA